MSGTHSPISENEPSLPPFSRTSSSSVRNNSNGSSTPVFLGTDNRCCFCLTLRSGSIIVAIVNALVAVLLFSWYATSPTIRSSWSHPTPFTDLDIVIVAVVVLQVLVDAILVGAAVKKQPAHTVPWLCTNGIIMGVVLVMLTLLLFYGFSSLALSYDEYVSILSLIGCVAGCHLFSCLVVFQFRKNLIEDAAIRAHIYNMENGVESGPNPSAPPRVPSPPPTYEEVSKFPLRHQVKSTENSSPPDQQSSGSLPPPEYEAAIALWKP